jgi:hypothetical protein
MRIGIIFHLCILFTVLASYLGYPFLEETLAYKKYLVLYHHVMGRATPGITEDSEELERNRQRFALLSVGEQQPILDSYRVLQERSRDSFWKKLSKSFHILVKEVPPFAQGWFLFSFLICLLLLFRVEGAKSVVWILPILTLCYGVDSVKYGTLSVSEEQLLFPSEEILLKEYLNAPLESGILNQYLQLQRGWHLYVIREWAHEIPSVDSLSFNLQVERGEFAFNKARIQALPKNSFSGSLTFKQPLSSLWLLIYFLWNCFFAILVHRNFDKESLSHGQFYRSGNI